MQIKIESMKNTKTVKASRDQWRSYNKAQTVLRKTQRRNKALRNSAA